MNYLNAHLLLMLIEVLPKIKEYEGKRIRRQTGLLSNKFKVTLPDKYTAGQDCKQFHNTQFWFDVSAYSMWIKAKLYLSDIGHAEYFEKSIYIGSLKDDVLTEVLTFETIVENWSLKKEYTGEELEMQVSKYKTMKETVERLFNEIPDKVKQVEYLNR